MSATRSLAPGGRAAQSGTDPLESSELRRRRRALGLTQAELADRLAVSANTVARWERGELRIGHPRQVTRVLGRLEHASQSGADRAIEQLNSRLVADADGRLPRTTRASVSRQRAPARVNHNLPNERTSLIGREQELEAIRVALLESAGRLITLTGPGGIGKTRLAQRLGRDVIEVFADGVWLVEVASQSDPARLPQTAASVLGVRERPGQPLLDTLIEALLERHVLLVLDNCEHLVDACAMLADALLSGCPRLSLLATSREPLHLSGEVVWRVPPLVVPRTEPQSGLDELSSSAAVRLFLDRACSARSDFALTPHNTKAVAHICTLLEGLPLALELAAARVRVLGTEQIEDQLRGSMRLLVDETRSRSGRHRSVEAALDLSYELLSEREQTVFRRLAVFAGGCTLEDAQAVCGNGEGQGGPVLDVLTQLVDKSLVLMEEDEGYARYRLLEPIRQYANTRLLVSGDAPATRQRHASHFCGLSEELASRSVGKYARAVDDRQQRELANFRVAMDWAIESEEAEVGLRVAAALGGFWTTRGWLTEGREWLRRLLDLPSGARLTPVRAHALQIAGNTAYYQGDHSAAASLVAESVALWRVLAAPAGLAETLDTQGLVDWARTELDSARTALAESLELARGLGLRILEGRILYHLGLVAYDSGDFAAAEDWHRQSMAVANEVRDPIYKARAYYGLGQVARQRGDLVQARALHQAGLACRREAGERWGMALALVGLGQVRLDERDLPGAHALFAQSLLLSRDLGDRHGLARALEGMAAVCARGAQERAGQLAGAAAALRIAAAAPLSPSERNLLDLRLTPVRVVLGDQRVRALIADATAMPLDEAIALALSSDVPSSTDALPGGSERSARVAALTARETQVLRLISCGKSNTEIADELVLSVRTVERHITNLYAKIGARNKADATAYAFRHELS